MKKAKYFVLFLTGMTIWASAVCFTTTHTVFYMLPLSVLGGYISGKYLYKFIKYKS